MPDLPVLSETASSFCLWDAEIPADKNKVPVESASFPAGFHSSFHTFYLPPMASHDATSAHGSGDAARFLILLQED